MDYLIRQSFFYLLSFLLCASAIAGANDDATACGSSEVLVAQASMKRATDAIDKAISAIDHASAADMARLATWFGAKSSTDAQEVRKTLVSARVYAGGATYLCSKITNIKLGDVYAYVRPDNSFVIVLGAFFFTAPDKGFDSKLGVLVHEMTHFTLVGATEDQQTANADGPPEAKGLAKTDPAAARRTANNYEYFVEAVAFGL